MSLGLDSNKEMTGYLNSLNNNFDDDYNPPLTDYDGTVWFARDGGGFLESNYMYLDKFDLIQMHFETLAINVDGPTRFDPALVDASTSGSVGNWVKQANLNQFCAIGAYDPSTGNQRLFTFGDTIGQQAWKELSMSVPNVEVGAADTWPNTWTHRPSVASGISNGDDGDWTAFYTPVIFPDWDGGKMISPAMTELWHDGTNKIGSTGLIDLTTGVATPIADMFTRYMATPNHEFVTGRLFNEPVATMDFGQLQFIPDDDSTGAVPKGRLFFSTIVSALKTAGIARCYFKFIDFNPLAVPGTPTRIHLRERLVSKFLLDTNGPWVEDTNAVSATAYNGNHGWIYVPTINKILLPYIVGSSASTSTGQRAMVKLTPEATLATIGRPAPRQSVRTNRTQTFGSEARGDLGEFIVGQDVTWALERITTIGEDVSGTPTPGESGWVSELCRYRLGTRPRPTVDSVR